MHWGQFKPVSQILMKLPPAEQEELPSKVMAIVRNLGWTDIGELTMLAMGNEAVQKRLWELLMSYIKKKP
ncbi:Hypothetical protein D623_10000044 [Myotis brandtii]|uniref:Uncharacterized protein n=1 Tax=Myotis brandtii TaxID=109478 RepID=S7NUN1_MYOBR|nr:Hypothetical protein D623_10000588 [Myotis brandtii]EPQ20731.1 Hypothetical protein D623_10000044 [Myotis brandtii]